MYVPSASPWEAEIGGVTEATLNYIRRACSKSLKETKLSHDSAAPMVQSRLLLCYSGGSYNLNHEPSGPPGSSANSVML